MSGQHTLAHNKDPVKFRFLFNSVPTPELLNDSVEYIVSTIIL